MKFLALLLLWPISAQALPLVIQDEDLGGGSIQVMASFDNSPVTMTLDTGANQSQFAKAPWNQAYPVLRQGEQGGASGIRYRCDVISLATANIEGFSRGSFEARRCDVPGVQPLLGLDFFGGQILRFDFGRKFLEINEAGFTGRWPLKVYGKSHIGIDLKINGLGYFGLFDTGAGLTSVDQKFADEHPEAFTFVQMINDGKDAGGNTVAMKLYKIKSLEIDGVEMRDEYALAFDFGGLRDYFGSDTPLVVGFNIIRQHNWTIDLRNFLWDMDR